MTISGVNPLDPGTPITSPDGITSTNNNKSPATPVDTASSASSLVNNLAFTSNPTLQQPDISIITLAQLLSSTRIEHDAQIWLQQQQNAVAFRNLYLTNSISAADFAALIGQVSTIANQMAALYNGTSGAVGALNNVISNYNTNSTLTQDQAQVNAMNQATQTYNQAVADFNAGTITQAQYQAAVTAYQSARTTYNTYANAHNSSDLVTQTNQLLSDYNQGVAELNQQIELVNSSIGNTGIPPLSEQETYNATASLSNQPGVTDPPTILPTLVVPTALPNAVLTVSPAVNNPQDILNNYLFPIMNEFIGVLITSLNYAQVYSNYNEFLQFYLQGFVPTILPSFINELPVALLAGGPGGIGAGSGVSLITFIVSIHNPLLSGIIDQSIFRTLTYQFSNPNNINNLLSTIGEFNLRVMRQLALQSALKSLPTAVNFNPSTIDLALGLSFANQVGAIIDSGKISDAIHDILTQAFPNVPANSLSDLAKQLASASELLYLEVAISQLGQALNNPTLFGQILGSLENVNVTPASSQQIALTDVIHNPISIGFLKNTLANSIVRRQASQNRATNLGQTQQTVNQAVNATVNNSRITTVDQFRQSLQDRLGRNAANVASGYLNSEIHSNYLLDTSAYTNRINQSNLVDRLVNQNIDANVASKAVSSAITPNEEVSYRTLRDRLATSLVREGSVDEGEALLIATKALITPSVHPIPSGSLRSTLAANVSSVLGTQSGVGNVQNVTNQVVDTIAGSDNTATAHQSLRSRLESHLAHVINRQNIKLSQTLDNHLRSFQLPTLSLYVFNNTLRDPANTLVKAVYSPVFYGHPLPSNFQKTIDIGV